MRDKLFPGLAICLVLAGAGAGAQTLRIGLVRQFKSVQHVTVSSTAALRIADSSGGAVTTFPEERITLSADGRVVALARADGAPSPAGYKVEMTSASPNALITISTPDLSPARYRGKIEAYRADRGLLLVNVVDVEDYLRGVLPSEMPPSFQREALKAQAVAARTFAWANRGRHAKLGYDLCDSTDCQVYPGAAAENTATSEAVKETSGLVATYKGKLISAQYCSDCGGATGDGGVPYLAPVPDRPDDGAPDYCDHDGHCWTRSWPLADFAKLAQKRFPTLGGLRSVSVAEASDLGRVRTVKLEADKGAAAIAAAELRRLLGPTVVKSTVFTVKVEDGNVIFEGKGFGHGIGLCQFGANALASPPHNQTFDQILKHYYKGIEVAPLSGLKSPLPRPSDRQGTSQTRDRTLAEADHLPCGCSPMLA